jgi:hypothetical protein
MASAVDQYDGGILEGLAAGTYLADGFIRDCPAGVLVRSWLLRLPGLLSRTLVSPFLLQRVKLTL